jgi:hypothetical protein
VNADVEAGKMNDYQQEQLDALRIVRRGLGQIGDAKRVELVETIRDYMHFRHAADRFLMRYFSDMCTHTCYLSRTSACCSKDGIITFFADTVVNALHATLAGLDRLEAVLNRVNRGHRCVYLGSHGCMWAVRPVVCAMFLCDRATHAVFRDDPEAKMQWESLRRQAKAFKWPDRPVLFDELETVFLELGYRSTLMHLNFGPGMLRIKRHAGLL